MTTQPPPTGPDLDDLADLFAEIDEQIAAEDAETADTA